MPNRDGTGPQGKGPRTGAQMGACKGSKNVPFSQGIGNRGCGGHKGEGNRRRGIQNQDLSSQSSQNAEET